jgi:hypothetical protein
MRNGHETISSLKLNWLQIHCESDWKEGFRNPKNSSQQWTRSFI